MSGARVFRGPSTYDPTKAQATSAARVDQPLQMDYQSVSDRIAEDQRRQFMADLGLSDEEDGDGEPVCCTREHRQRRNDAFAHSTLT